MDIEKTEEMDLEYDDGDYYYCYYDDNESEYDADGEDNGEDI